MSEYPLTMQPKEVQKWLLSEHPPVCLDVRQPHEFDFCHLAQSVHIPLDSLEKNLSCLSRDKPLVVLCHHGSRSARACEFLRARGYQAININGGIDLWSVDCDSSIARY